MRFRLLSQVLIFKHVITLVKEEICQKKKNKKNSDLSTGNMPKSTNWQEVTYFQKRHWDSRFLLLICILQQYCYKCKLTFYKYLKYKYIIFLSACMRNITVWPAKQHIDCHDNCELLYLDACCTLMLIWFHS